MLLQVPPNQANAISSSPPPLSSSGSLFMYSVPMRFFMLSILAVVDGVPPGAAVRRAELHWIPAESLGGSAAVGQRLHWLVSLLAFRVPSPCLRVPVTRARGRGAACCLYPLPWSSQQPAKGTVSPGPPKTSATKRRIQQMNLLNIGDSFRSGVERPTGLEPATAGLEGRSSIQLNYGREYGWAA